MATQSLHTEHLCAYIYTRTYVYLCMHTFLGSAQTYNTYTHVHNTCVYIYIHTCKRIGIHVNTHLQIVVMLHHITRPLLSTQYLQILVPKTIKGMVFGSRNLKDWVLGPPGLHIAQPRRRSPAGTRRSRARRPEPSASSAAGASVQGSALCPR